MSTNVAAESATVLADVMGAAPTVVQIAADAAAVVTGPLTVKVTALEDLLTQTIAFLHFAMPGHANLPPVPPPAVPAV